MTKTDLTIEEIEIEIGKQLKQTFIRNTMST